MARIIKRIITDFDPTSGLAVAQIPGGAVTLNLRLYTHPDHSSPQIVLIVLMDDQAPVTPASVRQFLILPETSELPPTFIKYVATIPIGSPEVHMHVVEIAPGP
jgi:hypothetical protein